jgi:hypothetical protein
MTAADVFTAIASTATFISVILIWLTTRANNQRSKKELTIQYTDAHDAHVEELLAIIYEKSINGSIDLKAVTSDEKLRWTVEKYLFAMERLSVGINTNVLDIYIFDRIMGQKTIEHFDSLHSYIRHIRKEDDYPAKYTEFENLIEELRDIRKRRFPQSDNKKGSVSKMFDG